jgi:serine/threonine-protein kinase PpkA
MIEIPGYRIISTLGTGGMASVYLAIQESFEREVALKVMSPDLSKDPTFGERFLREAQIVSRLVHPNIVTVYDVGIHEGHYFLSMEHIPGQDLTRKRFDFELADNLRVIKDIASALDFAGKKGYVHRDVKPENIMLDEDSGRAVLMDFGIARVSDVASGMTQTGMAIGTPHYMSPEQARGVAVDPRADIYSLGVVLFLLLTGHVPYHADSAIVVGIMHVSEKIPRLPESLQIFQSIIDRVLAKDPAERYQTGADLISDLDAIAIDDIAAAVDARAQELLAIIETEKVNDNNSMYGVTRVVASAQTQTLDTPRAPIVVVKSKSNDHGESVGPIKQEAVNAFAVTADDRVILQPVGLRSTQVYPWLILIVVLVGLGMGGFYVQNDFSLREFFAPPRADNNIQNVMATNEVEQTSLIAQANALRATIDNDVMRGAELAAIYRAALNSQDPLHRQAAETGLEELQDFYIAQIKTAREENDMITAQTLTARVQEIFTASEKSTRLTETLTAWENHDKILNQLHQAEIFLRADALTAPVGANALEFYRQVLAVDPENLTARQGLVVIAGRFSDLASAQFDKGNITDALQLVVDGLAVNPNDPVLLQQRDALEKINNQQKEQTSATSSLLDRAKAQQTAGRLIGPRGDNALESYRTLLSRVPNHAEARAGEIEIEKALVQQISKLIQARDYSTAESSLAIARESFPQSDNLLSLNAELDQAQTDIKPRIIRISVSSHEITELTTTPQNSIPADRVIYVGIEYENFSTQTSVLQAILYDGARSHQIVQVPVILNDATGIAFFRMEQPVAGFAEGGYSIDLLLDHELLISERFNVKKYNAL